MLCLLTLMVFGTAEPGLSYTHAKNVVYAETHGIGLVMDVFRPNSEANGLAIVDIVSSGFTSERICVQQHIDWEVYQALCAHGYTVFAIRPGTCPRWSISEMQEHIRLGIRFVKAHASEYGVRPEPLGITGVSAGGYLACLTALTPVDGDPAADDPLDRQRTHVAAAAPVCPLTDLRRLWAESSEEEVRAAAEMMGFTPESESTREEVLNRADDLSPARLAKGDMPAFLLGHASGDPTVPYEHSEIMVKALEDAGADVQFETVASSDHVWPEIAGHFELVARWFDEKLAADREKAPSR